LRSPGRLTDPVVLPNQDRPLPGGFASGLAPGRTLPARRPRSL